jgi:dienelactone hydrolase
VVLAPGWGKTAATLDGRAAELADKGVVAMTIDYRGWGRSGGFLYEVTPIRTDDRLRFSHHTAALRIQRKRLIPDHQIMDIRNAVSWLQGEPGVDRDRVGVWGVDLASGHVVMVAASDPRIKAAVADAPLIPGRYAARLAWAPPAPMALQLIGLARGTLELSAEGSGAVETRAALAQYHPFHYLSHVPKTTAFAFVAGADSATVQAATKELTGPTEVVKDTAAAAVWLSKVL